MAAKLLEFKDELDAALHDTSKPWTKCLAEAEQKSGIQRLYIFLGLIGLFGTWLVFGYAAQLLCNFVGFIYPAYASMKALETKTKDDDTKWLTYWVVFACFSVAEFFSDLIVGWFPLYWLIKFILLVWMMAPLDNNGSIIVYECVIEPYVMKRLLVLEE